MIENELWKGFWGHVNDLRTTLIRIGCTIGAGFLMALLFYQPLIKTLTAESEKNALKKFTMREERVVNFSAHSQIFDLPAKAIPLNGDQLTWVNSRQVRLAPQEFIEYRLLETRRLLI